MPTNALRKSSTPALDPFLLTFMTGVAHYGATFIPLVATHKNPAGRFRRYEQVQAGVSGERLVQLAMEWLRRGREIGFLPAGGIWVLDADGPEAAEAVFAWLAERNLRPPVIRTPGGGAHFYFLLPPELSREGLKAHVIHPRGTDGKRIPYDFKLHGRTMVKLIGQNEAGIPYRVEVPWADPPILDPLEFLPCLRIYHPKGQRWIPCDRPLRDRICRGMGYLRWAAPIAISGKGGRQTLLGVCTHLTQYLKLDPKLSFWLLTNPGRDGHPSWNLRCLDSQGKPYPWAPAELIKSLDESVNQIPWQGVRDYEQQQIKASLEAALAKFFSTIGPHIGTQLNAKITMADLRSVFLRWYGRGEAAILSVPFGKAAAKAGLNPVQVTRAKVSGIRGIDLDEVTTILSLKALWEEAS